MYKQLIVRRHFRWDGENKIEIYEAFEVFIDKVTDKLNELSKDYTVLGVSYPDMKTAIITYKEKRKRYGKVSSK